MYSWLNEGGNKMVGLKEISNVNWKRMRDISFGNNEVIEGVISCVWAKCIGYYFAICQRYYIHILLVIVGLVSV